ncbi:MAG: rubredoxin [Gammaproteobacteria bacterium]
MPEFRRYQCAICGHVYDEKDGDPDTGLAPGTRWEDVPETWRCPECGTVKSDYELMD